MEAISGIYRFFNRTTGISYIGSSSNIKRRIGYHRNLLNKNKHWNRNLLNAWQQFTESDFVISVLEAVDPPMLLDRENYWMRECQPLFNIVKVAQRGRRGIKHSEESKKKMSRTRKGKYCDSNNHRYGKKLSPESIQKRKETYKKKAERGEKINHPGPNEKCRERARLRGKTLVGEKNPNFGKSHSKESRDKIAAAHAKTYQLVNPDGQLVEVVNMRQYCRDNNICRKAMHKLLAGETNIMIPVRMRKEKRGWTLPN